VKPLKEPGYVQKRVYHQWHQVPGHGLCPICGQFARVDGTQSGAEFKTQYRACGCGHRFQTVVKIG
jgi:predicted nucleic acid-binding Zn ribbon protein